MVRLLGALALLLGIGAAGGWALGQLWLFWIAPIAGGVLGAIIYGLIGAKGKN